jgi:hypothetical protein
MRDKHSSAWTGVPGFMADIKWRTPLLIPFEFPIKPHGSRTGRCESEFIAGWQGFMESPMKIRSVKQEGETVL